MNKKNQPRQSITWGPTSAGKLFTTSPDWTFTLDGEQFLLFDGSKMHKGDVLNLENIQVISGTFWSSVDFPLSKRNPISLDGIPNDTAKRMRTAVMRTIKAVRDRQRKEALLHEFPTLIEPILEWAKKAQAACKMRLETKGWLTYEFKIQLDKAKPQIPNQFIDDPEIQKHIEAQPKTVRGAIDLWKQNFNELADILNERHLTKELEVNKDFFNHVEKSPLTEEQAKAVVCFDNRVLLVASAGSGKTSTMVAKAGYALKKGYFPAERMLLLAFNNDAAAELRERIKARLEPLGLPADKVVAKTFHAFGLDIIGQATGKRPSLAPWVDSGRDIEALLEMVDHLKDQDPWFRLQWDMFRIVVGQDLPEFGKEGESPDSWDSNNKREGFWTLNNEVVKSRGELLIANWLFYNGVKYRYEDPYKVETADASHRQYRPDFYFPDVDAYLEHWALDQKGNPPKEFAGYKESMEWKRSLHKQYGTKLLETTTAGLWSGLAFSYLSEELSKLGLTLDPNPDRKVPGRKPIENPRLARTFRTFLTHAKSNRLTPTSLRDRLKAGVAGRFEFRHTMFLNLFERIWQAWEAKLRADKCIDFEDMLNQASDCVEAGRWTSTFELVMVDEFQDVSHARARLVAALINHPGKCLFAVGDDWQSINRFAGADLGVMTHFEETFGKAVTLKLETTFRCPQSLCDISSQFVQKNPNQIRKKVLSAKPDITEPVRILRVDAEEKIRTAVANRIEEIASNITDAGKKTSIYVLGRYNLEQKYVPAQYDERLLSVEFVTVHSSKGLEADHIIIPRMTSETLGFPSRIEDDPVLQLAMPGEDSFADSEERRLFYVGLTRSRATVTLITVAHKESPFIAELIKDFKIQVRGLDGVADSSEVCPDCKQGFLVRKPGKPGKYGPFFGCSRYPKCRHTRNIEKN